MERSDVERWLAWGVDLIAKTVERNHVERYRVERWFAWGVERKGVERSNG